MGSSTDQLANYYLPSTPNGQSTMRAEVTGIIVNRGLGQCNIRVRAWAFYSTLGERAWLENLNFFLNFKTEKSKIKKSLRWTENFSSVRSCDSELLNRWQPAVHCWHNSKKIENTQMEGRWPSRFSPKRRKLKFFQLLFRLQIVQMIFDFDKGIATLSLLRA